MQLQIMKPLRQRFQLDTILISSDNGNEVSQIPNRSLMWRCQTPQAFRQRTISAAYEMAMKDSEFQASDDCGVIKRYLPHIKIGIFMGSDENIKLTYARDMAFVAEQLKKH